MTMRQPSAMSSSYTPERGVRAMRTGEVRSVWQDANERGLGLGQNSEWASAAESFQAAVDALAGADPQEPGTHDALALVLSNLAVASFRAGRLDDGIRHAQRACALRVALVGEDAVAVARARSDLAVMLCSAGRTEEAAALINRAIVGVEHQAGEEDLSLVPVLENAARVALAMGQSAAAEPHLLRLHALLAAHELSVEPAELLLRKVATSRDRRRLAERAPTSAAPMNESVREPVGDFELVEIPSYGADDQPLRDAVALTDVLLRTTPSGSLAIRHRDPSADPWSASGASTPKSTDAQSRHAAELTLASLRLDTVQSDDSRSDALTLSEPGLDEVREADAQIALQAHAESVQSHDALEQMRSRMLAPLAEPMPIDLDVTADFANELERDLHATLPSSTLGFRVEYGFDGYEEQRRELSEAQPETQSAVQTEARAESTTARATTPRGLAIVMPTPSASMAALAQRADHSSDGGATDDDTSSPRNTLVIREGAVSDSADAASEAPRERRAFGAALRAGRATAPRSSHGVLIAAVITLAAGATAVWLYLNSGL